MKSPYQLCRRLQLRVPILIVFQPPACPQRRHPRTQFSLAKLIFLKMYVINPPIIFQMKSHSSKSGNLPFVQIGKQFNIFYLIKRGENVSYYKSKQIESFNPSSVIYYHINSLFDKQYSYIFNVYFYQTPVYYKRDNKRPAVISVIIKHSGHNVDIIQLRSIFKMNRKK